MDFEPDQTSARNVIQQNNGNSIDSSKNGIY